MKLLYTCVFILCLTAQLFAQDVDVDSLYSNAMKEYESKNYKKASTIITKIISASGYEISTGALYDAACIYSLNKEHQRSFKILNYLANNRFYSNLGHIKTDSDLFALHTFSTWKSLLKKIEENKKTQPQRTRVKIKTALLNAKKLLQKDDGNLWGKQIWHENVLFQDFENIIYSLQKLSISKTDDSILYFKKIPENTLSKTNTVQKYDGKQYATVLAQSYYLNDKGSTIIHELFHRLHFDILDSKNIKLKADPIVYLDNYDAREWLRLEYQALRNALKAIDSKEDRSKIEMHIKDAFLFRKVRQSKYKEFLKGEVEIETVEGLAEYTGIVLSDYPNKYLRAIKGIRERENASTYTRPFPYATGPAYGLIFDYLKLDWKIGLDKVYNFLEIYESKHLKTALVFDQIAIQKANKRNNYDAIHKEELARKVIFEKRIKYYTELLINKPTLQVTLVNREYSMSFNMNGTLVLKNKGIVYSGIKGRDSDGNNFGNFVVDPEKAKLGVTGVLKSNEDDKTKYTFPLPIKIEGKKIVGEFYTIELNDGWKVVKKNAKGDLEIVKKTKISANELIGKVSEKLSSLKTLEFRQKFTLNMPSRKYSNSTVFNTFLDLSSKNNSLGFISQLKTDDSDFIYNGSEFFTLSKNKKTIDVRANPTQKDVSGFMGFINSLVMLRNALPALIKDKSVEKSISEKKIRKLIRKYL